MLIDFTRPLLNNYYCAVRKEPDNIWLIEGKYPRLQIGDVIKVNTNIGVIFLKIIDRQYCKYQDKIFNFHGFAQEVLIEE